MQHDPSILDFKVDMSNGAPLGRTMSGNNKLLLFWSSKIMLKNINIYFQLNLIPHVMDLLNGFLHRILVVLIHLVNVNVTIKQEVQNPLKTPQKNLVLINSVLKVPVRRQNKILDHHVVQNLKQIQEPLNVVKNKLIMERIQLDMIII